MEDAGLHAAAQARPVSDPALHAANLAAVQLLLAAAGGWPSETGEGWTAAAAPHLARFFSSCVLTSADRTDARPSLPVRVTWDTWGRPADGEVRRPVLMRREPGPLPQDERVVVARTPEQLEAAERALEAGLETPGQRGALGRALLDAPLACAYALVDGAPAACAVAHDDGSSIGVYLVGTATPHRGRGLGAAVTAAAVAALPARPALLTSTVMGRPVYERLGFRVVGEATMVLRDG